MNYRVSPPRSVFALAASGLLALASLGFAQAFDSGSRTVTVVPSGGDDTRALQGAFDLCVAIGDGCTVRLAPGTFRTNQLVVIGFNGVFEGAGAEASIIEPFGVLTINTNDNAIGLPPSADNPWPALVIFIDVDMIMRDLGFSVSLERPVTTWHALGMDFTVLSSIVIITGNHSRADVARIRMDSGPGTMFGVNVFNGLFIEGILPRASGEWGDWIPLSGTFTVRDSIFAGPDGGVVVSNIEDATLVVTGNTMGPNSGPQLIDIESSSIVITNNRIDSLYVGVYLESGSSAGNQSSTSSFVLSGNDIRSRAFGVQILDHSETPAYEVLISGNRFTLEAATAGVMGLGSVGTIVRGNVFSGSAGAGVQVGAAPEDPAERPPLARGWIVAANDFTGLTVDTSEAWVTSFASDSLIVCAESVQDEGTGTIQTCR